MATGAADSTSIRLSGRVTTAKRIPDVTGTERVKKKGSKMADDDERIISIHTQSVTLLNPDVPPNGLVDMPTHLMETHDRF